MAVTENTVVEEQGPISGGAPLRGNPNSPLKRAVPSSPVRRLGGPSPARSLASIAVQNSRLSPRPRQSSNGHRSRKLHFYRNGDRFFAGIDVIVSPDRLKCFEILLQELSRLLEDKIFLANGVRFLFDLEGIPVSALDELQDGRSYVCSSGSSLKKLDYLGIKPRPEPNSAANENAFKRRSLAEPTSRSSRGNGVKPSLTTSTITPKRVFVFLNGPKPRQLMRLLLDDRTAQSFTHVLDKITRFFSPLPGAIRKVYNISLGECLNLADFFHGEIFVASVGTKLSRCDLDLDPDEEKLIVKRKISHAVLGSRLLPNANGGTYVISSRDNASSSPRISRRMTLPRGLGFEGSCYNVNHPPDIRDRYHIGKLIGNGNFATVHECLEWRTGRQAAMKIIEKSKIRDKKLLGNEIAILRRLSHPNIVNLLDEYAFAGRLYVVMELVKGGDLFSLISANTHFSESQTAEFLRSLCLALDYLHSNRVVHRDVKPENLLVAESLTGARSLKLADFGLAAILRDDEPLTTICGSPTYVAPEILTETGYGFKVDVWAAGVTTYILLCGYPPFQSDANDQEALFGSILSGQFEFRTPYWDHVSPAGRSLICRMIEVSVDDRYFAHQVLDHEWMKANCRLKPIREASVTGSLSSDSGILEHPVSPARNSPRRVILPEVSPAVVAVVKNVQPLSNIPRLTKKFSSNSVSDLPSELSHGFWAEF